MMTNKLVARARPRRSPCSLGAVLVVLALPPSAASAAQSTRAIGNVLAKAGTLIEKGKYEKAVEKLGLLDLSMWPDHTRHQAEPPEVQELTAQAFLYLAICSTRVGEYEAARRHAKAAIDLAQAPAQRILAYNELGLATLGYCRVACRLDTVRGALDRETQERLDEAETAFRRALDLSGDPSWAAPYVALGEVLALQGRHDEAETAFATYLGREPEGELAARAVSARATAISTMRKATGPMGCALSPIPVSGEVKPPVRVFSPNPQYTGEARKARIQGAVILEVTLDKTGAVQCVKVLKGLPLGLSEKAAFTLTRWRFEPATLNAEPVAVVFNVLTNFSLQ